MFEPELFPDLIGSIASLLGAFVAIIAFYIYVRRLKSGEEDPEVERVRRRIEAPEVATADKQYLLLREYHAQGLAQSKISFWFSLIFAALGFAVVVSSVFTLDPGVKLTEQGRTLITLIAGTVIDAVSALFFVQSNKARQLMVDFFDRLRSDRKLEEALRLAAGIDDTVLRSRLNALLSVNFAEVKQAEGFLLSVMGLQDASKTPGGNRSPNAANPTTPADA